jgi:hypothetical protein
VTLGVVYSCCCRSMGRGGVLLALVMAPALGGAFVQGPKGLGEWNRPAGVA